MLPGKGTLICDFLGAQFAIGEGKSQLWSGRLNSLEVACACGVFVARLGILAKK
jgi:hypothetical protein